MAEQCLLLRSAPNPCTAKKESFQASVECVGKNAFEECLDLDSYFYVLQSHC